jgi:ribosome maturation factor RimP
LNDLRQQTMKKDEVISKVEAIAEHAALPRQIEIVEVELKGSGRHHFLRIFIDKPEGVTHGDCEYISREVSAVLDAEDPFPGTWELEVSSPGVERKLAKWKDWERFTGKKVKVTLDPARADSESKAPSGHFEGLIARAEGNIIDLQLADGSHVTFPPEQVHSANLKFEW